MAYQSMKQYIAYLLAVLLLVQSSAAQNMSVSGHVTNQNGSPVPNALVIWRYDEESELIGSHAISTSLEDGYFSVSIPWKSRNQVRVFFSSPLRNDCSYPISILSAFRKDGRLFPSVLIPEFRPTVKIEKVTEFITYGVVEIGLGGLTAAHLQDALQRKVYLKISTPTGLVINNASINNALDKHKRTLTVCLPKGEWRLSLYESSGRYEIGLSDNRVSVDTGSFATINASSLPTQDQGRQKSNENSPRSDEMILFTSYFNESSGKVKNGHVRAFCDRLKKSKNAIGLVVYHPSARESRQITERQVERLRRKLQVEQKLDSEVFQIKIGEILDKGMTHFYVMPKDAVSPRAAVT